MGVTILAGVDEAGLGPTLGPLVTACAALAAPDDWTAETPWERLADVCVRVPGKGETRPAVDDSKVLHRTGGLAALELAVGAFSHAAHGDPSPRFRCSGGTLHPCYSRGLDPFPSVHDEAALRAAGDALRDCLRAAGAAMLRLQAAALHEPEINRRYDQGLNKNQLLLTETGAHLRDLVDAHPDAPMTIVVDKQGGRNTYLPFLTALFPGAWFAVLEEGRATSRYRMRRAGGDVDFHFRAKADRHSFPTALASLAAKYARERAMAELNEWFAERVPELRPTAGYPEDARRWLADVHPHRERLTVALLVRNR